MSAILIEGLAAAVVFAAVYAAYAAGRGRTAPQPSKTAQSFRNEAKHLIRRYRPPVEIVLDYENENSLRTCLPTKIGRSAYGDNGRLYLEGVRSNEKGWRSFRVDRIICVATTDGEVIDTYRFLIDRLRIPADLCAASSGQTPSSGLSKPASANHF